MLLTHYKFINAVNTSKCVLTDGGGVAQETSFLGIPLIYLENKNKNRPPISRQQKCISLKL